MNQTPARPGLLAIHDRIMEAYDAVPYDGELSNYGRQLGLLEAARIVREAYRDAEVASETPA